MRAHKTWVFLLSVMLLIGLAAMPMAIAEEKLHYGGHLNVALARAPPA